MIKIPARFIVLAALLFAHQTSLSMIELGRNMMDSCTNVMNDIGNSWKYLCHDALCDKYQYRDVLCDEDPYPNYVSRINREFKEDRDVKVFFKEFSPPKDLLADLMQKKQLNIYDDSLDSLHPGFIGKHKYPLTRVLCAKRLQNMIAQNGYSRVAVPNKYLFLTDSYQSDEGKKFCLCISEKIIPTKDEKIIIDLPQMKELVDVVLTSGFRDAHPFNFIVDQQKRIVFIDTDVKSFVEHGPIEKSRILEWLWHAFNFDTHGNYNMHDVQVETSVEAKTYLQDLISQHKESSSFSYRSFTQKNEYDSKNLKIAYVFPKINMWTTAQQSIYNVDPVDNYS